MPSGRAEVSDVAVSPDHYIGGRRVGSSSTFESRSPLDWDWKLAEVARGDAMTADLAVSAAARAFHRWSSLTPHQRADHLHRLAELIDENADDIAIVECADVAMLLENLQGGVVRQSAEHFRVYADLAAEYRPPRWSSAGTDSMVQRMPAGPVVIITRWNAPWQQGCWNVAAALAAGNTVILKPAEWAPLSSSLLADLAAEAGFPPGVFNVVQGTGEEVGAPLVSDHRVARISFAGSKETARHVVERAARNLIPYMAELCGSGPFVVFADSDLDAAAKSAARQYDHAGQSCFARTRLIVDEVASAEFLELFGKHADAHVLGDSRSPSTTIPPLIHPDHLGRVEGIVDRAREAGDVVLRGGERWKQEGLWYEPTLIQPKGYYSEVVQREIFGPVVTFQTFADEGEAVELANSTGSGVSATVYAGSEERATRVASAIRAGTLWVNTSLDHDPTASPGGGRISRSTQARSEHILDFHSDLTTLRISRGTAG